MAVHLNDEPLLRELFERIPAADVPAAAGAVPTVYLPRVLSFLAVRCGESPHLEFHLRWLLALLQAHGDYLREHGADHVPTLRAVHRALADHVSDLSGLCHGNQYSLAFLASTARSHGAAGSLTKTKTALVDGVLGADASGPSPKVVAGDGEDEEGARSDQDGAEQQADSDEEAAFAEWAATTGGDSW